MKKILFLLVVLACSMSVDAQIMRLLKKGKVVASYTSAQVDSIVFEQEPKATGTAKATINDSEVDVNWVQLWAGGPKFAEYNVGVTDGKAQSFGGYYCWGSSINKDPKRAFKTGNDALTGTDDIATNLWGSNWRMPTKAELQALIDNCNVAWTNNYKRTGVKGRIFTGKGDYASHSLFIPATGALRQGTVLLAGKAGLYWASTPNGIKNASTLYITEHVHKVNNTPRDMGCSVRAVLAE